MGGEIFVRVSGGSYIQLAYSTVWEVTWGWMMCVLCVCVCLRRGPIFVDSGALFDHRHKHSITYMFTRARACADGDGGGCL